MLKKQMKYVYLLFEKAVPQFLKYTISLTTMKTIRLKKLSIIIGISILFTIIPIGQPTHAQPNPYNPSYCQGKKDEMLTRWNEWADEWSTARTDPNGQIREKGKTFGFRDRTPWARSLPTTYSDVDS
jgi:hypothetical protein